MPFTGFKKPKEIIDLVNHLDVIFRELQVPLVNGRLVEDVAVTTSGVSVPHKLSATARGWVLVRKNANADVWDNASPDGNFLYLKSDAAVTVSLWVF